MGPKCENGVSNGLGERWRGKLERNTSDKEDRWHRSDNGDPIGEKNGKEKREQSVRTEL